MTNPQKSGPGQRRWSIPTTLLILAETVVVAAVIAQPASSGDGNKAAFPPRGAALQKMVMNRCEHIAHWNRPYQYDGVGDCYGYCRQVWNAILSDGREHAEDYYPHPYDKKRWINIKGGIPVNTFPDTNWVRFSSAEVLVTGDLLATDEGHRWGENWHGGIYAGNGENWDCSRHNGLDGAYKRPLFDGFHYYYKPLHDLLVTNSVLPPAGNAVPFENTVPAAAATRATTPSDAAVPRR